MWDILVLTILNHIRFEQPLPVFVVVTIACVGALIVSARARQASSGEQDAHLAAVAPGIRRSPLATHSSPIEHPNTHPIYYATRHTASFNDAIPPIFDHSASAMSSTISAFSGGWNLFASAAGGTGDMPRDTLAAPEGDDAPEDAIAPPIWRRVESLIEEHREATLALTGEALGEAALIPPAPLPIWREVSALRIEVAEMEGAPEIAELQEANWANAPAPPIWRAMGRHERVSPALSLAAPRSEYDDMEPADIPELADTLPLWNSWAPAGWSEERALLVARELAKASARSDWNDWVEPPIWSSYIHPR